MQNSSATFNFSDALTGDAERLAELDLLIVLDLERDLLLYDLVLDRRREPDLDLERRREPDLDLDRRREPDLDLNRRREPDFDLDRRREPDLDLE